MPVVTLTKTLSNMWSADLESVNKTHMRKNKALVEETQIIFLIEQKQIRSHMQMCTLSSSYSNNLALNFTFYFNSSKRMLLLIKFYCICNLIKYCL